MKKTGVIILAFLLILSLTVFASAEENATCDDGVQNQNETGIDCGGECPECDIINDSTDDTTPQQDPDKIEKAFDCLKEKVDGKCASLSVQEIALVILASPEKVVDECVKALEAEQSTDNSWNKNIRDTALAILALDHVGKNTDQAENWLIAQNKTPTDLTWYLEQDSTEKTQCKFSYNSKEYSVNIGKDKKIDSSAGSCLTRAQSNFWLQISQNCLNTEFSISCDQEFIATLLYKQKDSPTIYVMPDTKSDRAFGTINLKVNAKCFGASSCNYEDSAWAAVALRETGHDVDDFVPYIIAAAPSNEKYLPDAFVYLITNYDDYATDLIQDQKLGNYWQADTTAYNKFYDTGLALLAIGSSSNEKVVKAKDWLLFSQTSDGCWKNSNNEIIRDTAMILWGMEGRAGATSGGGTTYCSEGNYFCIPDSDCPEGQRLSNYFCPGLSTICCTSENLKTCSEYTGQACSSDEFCNGNERKSSDEPSCCLGVCEERSEGSECDEVGYICKDSCPEDQEEIPFDCDTGVCCRAKTTPDEDSNWWLWLLIIGILVVAGIILFLLRDRLKMAWFKTKSKFGKDKGRPGAPMGSFPPRPGFPPITRTPLIRTPTRAPPRKSSMMDETFKKLKEMTK